MHNCPISMRSETTYGEAMRSTMWCVDAYQHLTVLLTVPDRQTDREAAVIRLDESNTVMSLRDQLLALIKSGNADSGFPILREDGDGQRMVGYIGANELEHALSTWDPCKHTLLRHTMLIWFVRHRGRRSGRSCIFPCSQAIRARWTHGVFVHISGRRNGICHEL